MNDTAANQLPNLSAAEVGAHFNLSASTILKYIGEKIIPDNLIERSDAARIKFKPGVIPFLEKQFSRRPRRGRT